MSKVLITGITGQDGSYMAEHLLSLGYEVHGIVRRSSVDNLVRIRSILDNITLHYGDMLEQAFLDKLIRDGQYDYIYNFAAQSHVGVSFSCPKYTFLVNFIGPQIILDAIRMSSSHTRFYQASTSEMFGNSPPPQGIETPFDPQSSYAQAKMLAHYDVRHDRTFYRELGLYAVSGILFNHESPRRGEDFVTKKIIKYIGDLKKGISDPNKKLRLGNIDAQRDWGYALEYMIIIHQRMTREKPEDFVLGTGETHSVQEFLDVAFQKVGLNWEDYTEYNQEEFLRPREVHVLCADTDIEVNTHFDKLIDIMLEAELYGESRISND